MAAMHPLDTGTVIFWPGDSNRGSVQMPATTDTGSALLKRAVFVDRDGVINRESGYVTCKKQLQLLPGATLAIQRLRNAGLYVVVVTNQSAIARGMLSEAKLGEIHNHLRSELASFGAEVDGIYYCPHHPSEAISARYLKNRWP
jgi:D-glycero-D-manno-heptose 1,7-bisphosphate phosphatase